LAGDACGDWAQMAAQSAINSRTYEASFIFIPGTLVEDEMEQGQYLV